jgi:hypothetical protein
MRFWLILLAIAGCSILYAGDAASASDQPKDKVKATDIAATYGITADSVDRLKDTYTIGYGGISKAFALAQKSGLSVDEILRMKTEDNLGWGEIAKKLELKPGVDYKAEAAMDDKSEAKMEKQQARMEQRAEKRAEKMEKKSERSSAKGVK